VNHVIREVLLGVIATLVFKVEGSNFSMHFLCDEKHIVFVRREAYENLRFVPYYRARQNFDLDGACYSFTSP